MTKIDVNDLGADNIKEKTEEQIQKAKKAAILDAGWSTASMLRNKYGGNLRDPIIDGILRRSEIMNIIAPSKAGKSYLIASMALSVAAGRPWLRKDWICPGTGNVAIIDNELHEETISHRITKIREGLGIWDSIERNLFILSLRGKLKDIKSLNSSLLLLKPYKIKLLILDSLYRLIPKGVSENDNSDMTDIYNHLDNLANLLQYPAIVVIHHCSKGLQAEKEISDVGAGAGAQSRAVDTHMILRPHLEKEHFIVEAVTRSWQKPEKFVVHWNYPIYELANKNPEFYSGIDPSKMKNQDEVLMDICDSEFCELLTSDGWITKRNIVYRLKTNKKITYKQAEMIIDNVFIRNNLQEISSEEGIKDFGSFYAKAGIGGAIKLKLKEK